MGKRVILAGLLASCCFVGSTQAQTGFGGMFPGPGTVHSAGGGSYSGPGDVVAAATSWYGIRAFNAAQGVAAAKAIQLCTALDGLCTDVRVTSTGGLNSSDLSTAVCNLIDTCTVKILYDQSGTNTCSGSPCDSTQSTIANRFTFKNNCTGSGKPCLVSTGSPVEYVVPGNTTNQPITVSTYIERTGNFTSFGTILGDGIQEGFSNAADTVFMYAGGSVITTSATDGAFHAMQAVLNGASGVLYIDGSATSGNPGGNGITGGYNIASDGGTNYFTGEVTEVGYWSSAFSGGNQSGMNANQTGYY